MTNHKVLKLAVCIIVYASQQNWLWCHLIKHTKADLIIKNLIHKFNNFWIANFFRLIPKKFWIYLGVKSGVTWKLAHQNLYNFINFNVDLHYFNIRTLKDHKFYYFKGTHLLLFHNFLPTHLDSSISHFSIPFGQLCPKEEIHDIYS